ncbi:MAG: sulfotransferase domain-containing protein [bacterium]
MIPQIHPQNASRILVNSLPKSGTHLLAKAIELLGFREHFSANTISGANHSAPMFLNYREAKDTLIQQHKPVEHATFENLSARAAILVGTWSPISVETDWFNGWFNDIPAQRYIIGHLPFSPTLSQALRAQQSTRHVFIIRDPRAVLVSMLSFILDTQKMPKPHFLADDFRQLTQAQQLDLLLHGGYAPQAQLQIIPFSDIFQQMLAWQQDSHCCFMRFEALIGEQGGGSAQQQKQVMQQLATYLGYSSEQYNSIDFSQIYNTQARTFRKGRVSGWQQGLPVDLVQRIEDYCRPLCQAAGYEE